MTDFEIRAAVSAEEIVAASHLFDNPAKSEWAQRFLNAHGHHLLLAWVGGEAAGFVSGIETTHPDKGTEMFLYELAVDDAYQRRGIGAALVDALAKLARDCGCYGIYVFTERENTAAVNTYRKAGITRDSDHVMLSWEF